LSSYASIIGHRSMVFDDVRNTAYGLALDEVIRPDSVVLDLGSGLGIHGLMAAARGARRVYLVDPSPVNAVAAKVAAANAFANNVICIQERIENADLPEKVDVIVSVFTGNFLLEEDLLPSLFFARDRYLKADGKLIPGAAEMRVAPVTAESYFQKHISSWSQPSQAVDFSMIRKFAANATYYDGQLNREAEFLAEAKTLAALDFATAQQATCSNEIGFMAERDGICHGFLGWFRMQLGTTWLSTSPLKPAMHWSQVFLPVDPPLALQAGDQVSLKLTRPQFGEWSWIYEHNGLRQIRSTFLSHALDMVRLQAHNKAHKATLSEKGEVVKFVTTRMDGLNTVEMLVQSVIQEFGRRFSSAEELTEITRSILSQYGR
jgi:predicted RNA methylase